MANYSENAARRLKPTINKLSSKALNEEVQTQVKISNVNEYEPLHTERSDLYKKLSMIVVLGLILSYVLYLRVVQVEVDTLYGNAKKEYAELSSEQVRMQMELEAMAISDNFEAEVANKYGLQKLNDEQVTYVDLQGANKIVIPKK